MLFLVSTLGVLSDVKTLFRDIAAQVQSNSSYGTIRVHVYNYSYDFFFHLRHIFHVKYRLVIENICSS